MAKKTKAKKTMSRKKRTKIPSDYEKIERIWAEHGVVRVSLKTGAQRSLSVRDAAMRARQLNCMDVPVWHKPGLIKLIEKIVEVCREAAYQVERGDKKATQLSNMYLGKAPDGRPVSEIVSEDRLVQGYQIQFPTLKDYEIRAVLRDDRFKTDEQRILVMRSTHAKRLVDDIEKHPDILGPDGRPVRPV